MVFNCIKKIKLTVFTVSFLCISFLATAWGQINDSTLSVIKQADNIEKITILLKLTEETHERYPIKAIEYGAEALKLSRREGVPEYQADALFYIGLAYYFQNQYDPAIDYFKQAARLREKLDDRSGLAMCLNRTGNTYQLKGDFIEAFKYYQEAMDIFKEIDAKKEIARTLTNLGSIHQKQGNYKNAIDYYLKALNMHEQENNKEGMAWSMLNIAKLFKHIPDYSKALRYVNRSLTLYTEIAAEEGINTGVTLCQKEMGNIYQDMGQYDKALEYSKKVLSANEATGNKFGVANSLGNTGKIYYQMGNYDKALDYLRQAIDIKNELHDNIELASLYRFLGNTYMKKGNNNRALDYMQKSLDLAEKQNLREEIKETYKSLANLYTRKNNYQKALTYFQSFSAFKDSLNIKEITQLEMQFEFNKKQRQLEFEQQQREAEQAAKLQRQKILTATFVGGFVVVIFFSLLLYKNYKQKKSMNKKLIRQNDEIRQKNEEIEAQRDEIEAQRDLATSQRDQIAKQKDLITDSIEYAQRIQHAALPQQKYVDEILPEHFILFKPRDIVSGDFYWVSKKENKSVIVAADCTGHGVPGAFMSMLGISLLNEIVNKGKIRKANEILDVLRKNIIEALHQSDFDSETKDGMDIALCILDEDKKMVQFAGAHNPLYLFRNNELIEYKGNKMPIGVHVHKKAPEPFTNHDISLEKGDVFYLFSDGYHDQFGGEHKQKLKKSNFKNLLMDIHTEDMAQQKNILEEKHVNWRGQQLQIDDILVIGIKV